MTFVPSINQHVQSVDPDPQLEGLLESHRREGGRSRPDYYYLKDLTNPQQNYWEHLDEAPEHTEELSEILSHGEAVHRRARQAFSLIDGFAGAEGILDGAENGIPGVRGKVDFKYYDSLVEFKTTAEDLDAGEDVWENAPQAAEQLLFYSALWTSPSTDHYLIFHKGDGPESVVAFRVEIDNPGMVRNQLESRMSTFDRAIEIEDPSLLYSCRFFDGECHVRDAELCNCNNLEDWDTEPLQRVSNLYRDEEVESVVIDAFHEVRQRNSVVSPWDLETPRQWLGLEIGQREEDDWTGTDGWAFEALRSADLLPSPMENEYIPQWEEPLPFKPPGVLIQRSRTTSTGSETRWIPTMVRSRNDDSRPSQSVLRNYIMQLGCSCALYGSGIGLLVVELPEAEIDVAVYRVTFDSLADIETKIRENLRDLEYALESEDPSQLPECPEWLQERRCEDCLCR